MDQKRKRLSKNSIPIELLSSKRTSTRIEEDIRALKRQMEFILGVTKTGLDIIDSQFNVRYIDPEWAKVYGDPTGKKCYQYFMDRSGVCPGCGIPKALEAKTITVSEEILVKEGSRPIQVTTIPFQNTNGEWLVAEVNVDASERKRAEEALRKAHDELEIRVRQRTTEVMSVVEALQNEMTERKLAEEALRKSEEEAKRFAQENAIMAEIGRIISSSLNIEDVYERFAEEAHKLIHFDGIAINIINHNESIVTVPYVTGIGVPGCQPGDILPLEGSVTGDVMRTHSSLMIQTEDRGELQNRHPTLLSAFDKGLRSLIVVPLISKDQVIGAIHFRSTKSNAYSDQDLKLAQSVASQIAGAIANAQLFTEHKRSEEMLRESEEKYRTIIENIEDGYYEVDLPGNFTFFNDSVCRLFGYSRDEVMGMNDRQYTDHDHAKQLYRAFNKVYRTGEPTKGFDWEIIRKDGTKRYIQASVSLIKNPSGQPTGFRGIVRDITERKQAEEALAESEEKFRAMTAAAADAITVMDNQGRIAYWNPAAERMFGYLPQEAIGKELHSVLAPRRYHEAFKKGFENFRETGQGPAINAILEFIATRNDGTEFPIEVSTSAIKLKGQWHAVGIIRDITERKRAEEALRESQQLLKKTFVSLHDAVFIIDAETVKIMDCNPAASEMFGYAREEMVGQPTLFLHVDSKALQEFRTYMYASVEEKGFLYLPEFRMKRKDGEFFSTEHSVIPLEDDQGKRIGWVSVVRDITERKRAEKKMAELQEQLRHSQRMEAVGRLGGGIAHDFNNLLTIIKGYAQLSLLDLKESDPLCGNIQEIQKAAQRATDLTRQLLAFSRRQILDLKVLDLNSLLKDLNKMLRRIIGEDVELVTLLPVDLGRVKIDPGQIEQVIFNLAVNARDAMPFGGKLLIETTNVELDKEYANAHIGVVPGCYVKLSVSDTGIGMSQEVREKVFEPFFTTKDKGKGTGLGLSTVYGIVKQSGGNIWVYSEPGHGTTFKIYLPRVEEELDTIHGRDETDDSLPRGNETVLLAEDEQEVRLLAHRLLSQQGYRVLEATNGEEALRVAQDYAGEKIHLLLTDVVMPQMGGKELADQLKILRPDVKVLYVSGYTDNAIVHQGVLDPGTHFLQKPFSPKTLSDKVREVLDR